MSTRTTSAGINSRTIVEVRLVHIGEHVWRVQRADTGKVLGLVEGEGRTWRASASMRAFLGDGPSGGEPLGHWVPRALYAPLMATEGDSHLPDTYRSQRLAVIGLQQYLAECQAPAMGYGPHEQVRKA